MSVKKIVLLLSVVAFVGSIAWLFVEQSLEPFIAMIGSIIGILSCWSDNDDSAKMTQKGGKNSTNFQATGSITINTSNHD